MYTEITIHVLLAGFIFNSCIGIWLGLRSAKFNEEAARAEERADRTEEEFYAMHQEIDKLNADLDERDAEIHDLNSLLCSAEGKTSLLGCQIAELKHLLADNHPDVLHCEITELKDRIAKRDAIIEDLTL